MNAPYALQSSFHDWKGSLPQKSFLLPENSTEARNPFCKELDSVPDS